ncbi:hypothetical protein WI60_32075 [Burkholderia cepacia]|nr:hypothetical protein WI60_32075 [Burkholderia cepacia]KVW19167.1 hypothetical protein WK91_10070 [Burkholderia cepacia]
MHACDSLCFHGAVVPPESFTIAFSARSNVGRAIPGAGWVLLATDISLITYRAIGTYNSIVKPEDRLYG